MRKALLGLRYLHLHKVIHRDIKACQRTRARTASSELGASSAAQAANILLTDQGEVKLGARRRRAARVRTRCSRCSPAQPTSACRAS